MCLKVCSSVEDRKGKFLQCSGCKDKRYCGRGCQKDHWKAGHRHICRFPSTRLREVLAEKMKVKVSRRQWKATDRDFYLLSRWMHMLDLVEKPKLQKSQMQKSGVVNMVMIRHVPAPGTFFSTQEWGLVKPPRLSCPFIVLFNIAKKPLAALSCNSTFTLTIQISLMYLTDLMVYASVSLINAIVPYNLLLVHSQRSTHMGHVPYKHVLRAFSQTATNWTEGVTCTA